MKREDGFNTHIGRLKAKLESVGVVFKKTGETWYAEVDGQTIGRHRQLNICIKEAADAYGEE